MRLRFPRAARLNQAREFQYVRETGRSWSGRFLVLGVLVQQASGAPVGSQASRVGFITSRRVGNAVERNRVRRRLREIIRANRPLLREGRWIVLVARRAAVEAGFGALREEWLRLAGRAGILRPANRILDPAAT
jgi:ribonuclease P protein component